MKKRFPVQGTVCIRPHIEISPEQMLANAIVACAAGEYINALIRNDIHKIRSNERFFYSEEYSIYTSVNPDYLIRLCKLTAEECVEKGIKVYHINRKGLFGWGDNGSKNMDQNLQSELEW